MYHRSGFRKKWKTGWCLLRQTTRANGPILLQYFDQKPSETNQTIKKLKFQVDIKPVIHRIVVPSGLRTSSNAKQVFAAEKDNVFEDVDAADRAYSFCIQTPSRSFIFCAPNLDAFNQWFDTLHDVMTNLNPFQVAAFCKDLILNDVSMEDVMFEHDVDFITSWIVENHCDSLKIQVMDSNNVPQLIPLNPVDDASNQLYSERIWKALRLQNRLPKITKHWDFIVSAVEHEISHYMAQVIKSLIPKLGELSTESAAELISVVTKNTNLNLNVAEKDYFRSLINRASTVGEWHSSLETNLQKKQDSQFEENSSERLIRDIFNTHKVFSFGSFNCREYKWEHFVDSVSKINTNKYRKIADSMLRKKENFQCHATLYPNYLIDDDIFEIMDQIFAVSDAINRFLMQKGDLDRLDVFCFVIPERVVSLYDRQMRYISKINDIENWIKNKDLEVLHRSKMGKKQNEADNLFNWIQQWSAWASISPHSGESRALVIIIDRSELTQSGTESLIILHCWSAEDVFALTVNHYIGLHFSICDKENGMDGIIVRSWLQYGNGQSLRFWPEQLVWFIPRLFVKRDINGHDYLMKIYSDDYKHGFCVDLNDPHFNYYYKLLTGWTHVSVNYRRRGRNEVQQVHSGLRDYVQGKYQEIDHSDTRSVPLILNNFLNDSAYCSDSIFEDLCDGKLRIDSNIALMLKEDAKFVAALSRCVSRYKNKMLGICTVDHLQELWHCPFVGKLVAALQRYQTAQYKITELNIRQFEHSVTIQGLDHLVAVHNMFSIRNRGRIQNYFMRQCGCHSAENCQALIHHARRRREIRNDSPPTKSYDDTEDVNMLVTINALSSAHCYLLHSEEALYRLSGDSLKFEMMPFSTDIASNTEDNKPDEGTDTPKRIDFGVHILQWLRVDQAPDFATFFEEMIMNPESTLSEEIWDEYRMHCVALVDGKEWTMEHLDELMCLKLYSDSTKLQNLFRKAFWKSSKMSPLKTKKQFYQWGLLMYKTFLYHARPIMKNPNGTGPCKLYHGLNQLFRVEKGHPTYHGPFSTTRSFNVANGFAKGRGLIFNIQPSYANPLRFVIGINMVRISCFKHEQEVLLYSQTLPIQSAKTYVKGNQKLVDHLMFSLKSTETKITDSRAFFKQIGIRFDVDWWPLILSHPALFDETNYGGKSIMRRLQDELQIGTDGMWDSWEEILDAREFNLFDGIQIKESEMFCFKINESFPALEFVYAVFIDGIKWSKDLHYDQIDLFSIGTTARVRPRGKHVISLQVKPDRSHSIYASIKSFTLREALSRYGMDQWDAMRIDSEIEVSQHSEYSGLRGSTYISCTSDIMVSSDGQIDANGVGLRTMGECVIQRQIVEDNDFVLTYGTRFIPRPLSPGGGGGIIALRSNSDIVNDGILSSNGTANSGFGGGSICLCADGAVVNRGRIESIPRGRIIVRCRRFVNEGLISPEPEVLITDGTEQREFKIVKMPWSPSAGKVEEIPLSIYRHRGHYNNLDKFHPRNLLDKMGTESAETEYLSTSPGVGDWIVFKLETPFFVIPREVAIRNDPSKAGLKSIELSISDDGNDDNFDHFATISNLPQDNDEAIRCELKEVWLSRIWMKDYKFIKLKVLENWGGLGNIFHLFCIRGIRIAVWSTDGHAVDHLLKSVKWERDFIFNKELFLRKIGLKFSQHWRKSISEHELLTEKTNFNDQLVFQRLVNEFDLKWLEFTRGFNNNGLPVPFAKSRYDFQQSESLWIDHWKQVPPMQVDLQSSGSVEIRSQSEILIDVGGGIIANGVGIKEENESIAYLQYVNMLRNEREDTLLLTFGTAKERNIEFSERGGGGIVALYSSSAIVNDGVLCSNGSDGGGYGGGSILLCASGVVINRGIIECRPSGRIIVQCREFVNEGMMAPEPEIIITDGIVQRQIQMVSEMPWNRSEMKIEHIPLTIYRHRGHRRNYDCYHPRNVLDKKGKETYYLSNLPAVGDWIIFKIESPYIVIPKAIMTAMF